MVIGSRKNNCNIKNFLPRIKKRERDEMMIIKLRKIVNDKFKNSSSKLIDNGYLRF